MQHVWQSVWAALTDDGLENRLRRYYWLTILSPHVYLARFLGLMREAERRGKPQIVEKAEEWMEKYGAPAPLA